MKVINMPQEGRLRGRAVLVSASVPTRHDAAVLERIEASEAIEEAVVSIARAVFSEGGNLVFGGHPTISPLIANVVAEYSLPSVAERGPEPYASVQGGPNVRIYQSEAYRQYMVEAVHRLGQQPGVKIHWVGAVEGEIADPNDPNHRPATRSLKAMRSKMVQEPNLIGMVCIGGMHGVEEEAVLFHEFNARLPVYALESTGGAAEEVAKWGERERWIRIPERGIRERLKTFWEQQTARDDTRRNFHLEGPFAVPYTYIAQKIVAEILNDLERGQSQGGLLGS